MMTDQQLQSLRNMGNEAEDAADEIVRLRAELSIEKRWGELWYFVSDEEPMKFEKIVSEWTPSRWIDQAFKLMAAKRGA
jgi:hypothetical protein